MISNRCLLFIVGLFLFFGAPEVYAKSNRGLHGTTIHCIGEDGIKIKKPGVYSLAKDIRVDLENGKAAITIDANNVTLDLKQYTLQQKGQGQNNVGILVKANHQSVTIENGAISNIHGFGIQVEEGNQIVNLQNLIVNTCGSGGGVLIPADNQGHTGGVLFLGTSASPIKDIDLINFQAIGNTTLNPLVAVNGLLMSEVDKVTIQNSHFNDNTGSSEIGVIGAEFFHTKNVSLKNSYANENSNHPTSGVNADCFGFHFNETVDSPIDSTEHFNIKVENCAANLTTGYVIRASGFRFRKAQNIVVENSESHQTINTLPDPANVDSTISAAAGFIFTICDNFNVRNCAAYKHLTSTHSERVVGGFDIARSNYGVLTECHAAQCQNAGGGVFGGFIVEPTISRPNYARSTGIIFENCISEGNMGSTNGGGFGFYRVEEGKIIGSEAINNSPNGIEVGKIPLIADDDTIHSLIKDNVVLSNSLTGIADLTLNSLNSNTNAYLGNIARDNGLNYVLPAGTPIVVWSLSTGGTLTAEELDNIDIQ